MCQKLCFVYIHNPTRVPFKEGTTNVRRNDYGNRYLVVNSFSKRLTYFFRHYIIFLYYHTVLFTNFKKFSCRNSKVVPQKNSQTQTNNDLCEENVLHRSVGNHHLSLSNFCLRAAPKMTVIVKDNKYEIVNTLKSN